jgi:hypothetical protein
VSTKLLWIFYYAQNKENIKYLPMVAIFKLFVLRAKTKYEYNCVNAIKRKTTLIKKKDINPTNKWGIII